MNVALYGKSFAPNDTNYIQGLIEKLEATSERIFIFEPFCKFLCERVRLTKEPATFTRQSEIRDQIRFLFSVGGDGTLLDTITLVGDTGIPIIGVNLGRLGFLSSISKDEIVTAVDEIITNNYSLDQRTLLHLDTKNGLFGGFNYALNDLTVFKKFPNSMLTIKTYINDEFLNTYWADGLIVATPTGSTAYSLSCTGPIITPHSGTFVITPIASHNLSVRPIVIPDNSVIRIQIEGRGTECSVSLDSRIENVLNSIELIIRKEDFSIHLLQMSGKNFFSTIREKLKWGLDIRN
ncbi:MAG: NAD kinase [Bacteroidetes bacterium]|nr:NAD kinase [Bacteroidota bacterium]